MRLIKRLEQGVINELDSEYLALAYSIEDSLIAAGAEPGKDYTYVDLYTLAQPFALELFKTRGNMGYERPFDKTLT